MLEKLREWLSGLLGKKPSYTGVFRMKAHFVPLHAFSHRNDKVELVVLLENDTPKEKLVSLTVKLPSKGLIGFNPITTHKVQEKKVGRIEPGGKREVRFVIYTTNQTAKGEYPVEVTTYLHYLDYDKIEGEVRKVVKLKVV